MREGASQAANSVSDQLVKRCRRDDARDIPHSSQPRGHDCKYLRIKLEVMIEVSNTGETQKST